MSARGTRPILRPKLPSSSADFRGFSCKPVSKPASMQSKKEKPPNTFSAAHHLALKIIRQEFGGSCIDHSQVSTLLSLSQAAWCIIEPLLLWDYYRTLLLPFFIISFLLFPFLLHSHALVDNNHHITTSSRLGHESPLPFFLHSFNPPHTVHVIITE